MGLNMLCFFGAGVTSQPSTACPLELSVESYTVPTTCSQRPHSQQGAGGSLYSTLTLWEMTNQCGQSDGLYRCRAWPDPGMLSAKCIYVFKMGWMQAKAKFTCVWILYLYFFLLLKRKNTAKYICMICIVYSVYFSHSIS